jgi:AraC-like DNA-binding protein
VAWDHRGRPPVTQEVLSDPCVNLAVEPAGVLLYGVVSGRSTHVLGGAGSVVGTKFRPGGFSGFVPGPVRALNDRVLSPGVAFGGDGERLERELAGVATTRALIDVVSAFLRAHRPPPDPQRALVLEIVEAMRAAPPGTRVAEVAARFALAPRTLQRLFAAHVGARPKQVLQRFRTQHATDQLAADDGVKLARLAADLGYFDQAHFVQDFRAATGRPPSALARA